MKQKSLVLATIFIVFAYLSTLFYSIYYNASNYDETANIVAGLSIWKHGRFDLYRVNPPLYKIIAAAPLLACDPHVNWKSYYEYTRSREPGARPEFSMAIEFAQNNRENLRRYLIIARLACVPFALLGAYYTWRWGTELFGARAGVVALAFWAFCPNLLTWSAFVLPDLPATALGVAFGYYFWRWLKSPSWGDVFWLGLLLGATWLTKFTWVLLVPLTPAIFLASYVIKRDRSRRAFFSQALQLIVVFGIGAFFLNLGYGFEGTFKPLGEFKFCSRTLAGAQSLVETAPEPGKRYKGGNRFKGSALASIPTPVPESYLLGIDLQKVDFEKGLPSYFNGEWSERGWKLFYWECAAFKIPLGALLLFFFACLLALRCARAEKCDSATLDYICLLAPGVTLFVFVSLQSGFSRHFRYVLPALPCFYIMASSVFSERTRLDRTWFRALAFGCVVWFVASALSVFPHSLSYFNALAGGPRNAWRYFLESNLDWGQDGYALQAWLDRRERQDVMIKLRDQFAESAAAMANYPAIPALLDQVSSDSTFESDEKRLDERLRGPRPGVYAISVGALYGADGKYRYLRGLDPVARIGYSINIYELDWDACARLRAEYHLPPLARPADDMERFFTEFCSRSAVVRAVRVALLDCGAFDDESYENFQRALGENAGFTLEKLAPWQIQKGELDAFDVVVVPGGQASLQAHELGVDGANAVRRFVEEGGGYFGVCAGAYLASTNEFYRLRLINLRALSSEQYVPDKGLTSINSRGFGRVDLTPTPQCATLFGDDCAESMENLFYTGGPVFLPGFQPDLPSPIVLATFNTEVAQYDFQRGVMIGAPAIALAPFGKGAVVVTSPHLENDAPSYANLRTLLRGVARAAF